MIQINENFVNYFFKTKSLKQKVKVIEKTLQLKNALTHLMHLRIFRNLKN